MTRQQLEEIESRELASYALKSADSRGRKYPEPKHPYRTEFQRDRDRIAHSTAFRRLQHKTQVFVTSEGDHYRTRLTHTIEVSLISRSIARALSLNEDLTEALALAHDLGHTPFGHTGEDTLNRILKDEGGFEHNRQCIRVVDIIETRYPNFPGLNLTYELREGILKHHANLDYPGMPEDLAGDYGPSLESQVVNIADEIAYNCHDIDDGLSSGLISSDQVSKLDIWRRALAGQAGSNSDTFIARHGIVRFLIDYLVTDLVDNSSRLLESAAFLSADDIRKKRGNFIAFSNRIDKENKELKSFLMIALYKNPTLLEIAKSASSMIEKLFDAYISNPNRLPPHIQKRLSGNNSRLIVGDYIAGMTDRFANAEYEKLCGG